MKKSYDIIFYILLAIQGMLQPFGPSHEKRRSVVDPLNAYAQPILKRAESSFLYLKLSLGLYIM